MVSTQQRSPSCVQAQFPHAGLVRICACLCMHLCSVGRYCMAKYSSVGGFATCWHLLYCPFLCEQVSFFALHCLTLLGQLCLHWLHTWWVWPSGGWTCLFFPPTTHVVCGCLVLCMAGFWFCCIPWCSCWLAMLGAYPLSG